MVCLTSLLRSLLFDVSGFFDSIIVVLSFFSFDLDLFSVLSEESSDDSSVSEELEL